MTKRQITLITAPTCPMVNYKNTKNCLECSYYAGVYKDHLDKYKVSVMCGLDNKK